MLIGYDASKLSWENKTGTEHYASILLERMLRSGSGHTFRLYVRRALPPDAPWLHGNVEQVVIPTPRLWTQLGLASHVWRKQPDVLFIPAHTMPILHRPSLKTVVTIHDLGYEYLPQYHQFPHKLYLNRTTEFAARHATQLIAVSEFTKQDLVAKLGVPASRISVVYEGVDASRYARPAESEIDRVRHKLDLGHPYILFVGTIQPRKNLVRLIEAFSLIAHTYPDHRLVLAGGKGWMSDEIYAAPERLGLADRVRFTGFVDETDKPALYAGADVTALVSLFEGFGLPVLESMACGTPVVASNTTSLPEVVGQAGVLVNPERPDDIAAGLDRVLGDGRVRRGLAETGREQVKKFSWDNAAQQTLDVLERAAA
jgi:glycosyltransferase involved in cell wall biosynthesis